MEPQDRFNEELRSIQREFPGFRIRAKSESWLCRVLAAVLGVLTAGGSEFMIRFHTVLGKTLYTGSRWSSLTPGQRWVVLVHERQHLRDARMLGLGWFWAGYVLWALSYLLVLPAGLTFRALWEYRAYKADQRASREVGLRWDVDDLVELFAGPQYFFMLPFRKYLRRKIGVWFVS